MELVIEQQPETTIVGLTGSFTFKDVVTFKTILNLLDDMRPSLVLDVHHVDFIDSAALGFLLLMREKNAELKKRIVLRRPRGQVLKMFNLSRLETLFSVEH